MPSNFPVKHTFVSAVADGGDATLVRPSNWNATHPGIEVLYKTTDSTCVSATTKSNCGELSFSIATNEAVAFYYAIFHTAAATTTGIGYAMNCDQAASLVNYGALMGAASNVFGFAGGATAYETTLLDTGTASTTVPMMNIIAGRIVNGGASGTVQVRIISEVGGSTVTVKAGSFGWVFHNLA